MALLYKGYAQQKGFDPIDVPDPSSKIRKQGLETLKGMEAQITWNRQQANAAANQLADNARFEADQRAKNWQLRQDFRDTVQEARGRQQKQTLENLNTQQKNRDARIKDIVKFTQTGMELYQKYDAKRTKDSGDWARDWQLQHGITSAEYQALRSVDDHAWEQGRNELAIYQELQRRGVSHEVMEQARGLVGYRHKAMQKLNAVNVTKDFTGRFLSENRNTELTILGKTQSLNDFIHAGDRPGAQQALIELRRLHREEYEGKYQGTEYPGAKILALTNANDIIAESNAAVLGEIDKITTTRAEERQFEDDIIDLNGELTNVGIGKRYPTQGDAIWSWIQTKQGGPDATRDQLVNGLSGGVDILMAGIEDGSIELEDVHSLLRDVRVTRRGSKKEQPFEEAFPVQANKLRTALADAGKIRRGQVNARLDASRIEGINMHADFIEIVENSENLTLETLVGLQNKAAKHPFGEKAHKYITTILSNQNNVLNDRTARAYIVGRIKNHEYITSAELNLLNTSAAGRAQLWKLIQENNKFVPTPDNATLIEDTVSDLLEVAIPRGTAWGSTYSRKPATDAAIAKVNEHYVQAMQSGKHTHETALAHALGVVKPLIQDPNGPWGRSLPSDADGVQFNGFKIQNLSASDIIVVDTPRIQQELTGNPDAIYSRPYLDKLALINKSSRLNKGLQTDVIPRASLLANLGGNRLSPIQVEQAQLEYWRNREIQETGSSNIQPYPDWYVKKTQQAEEWIHPTANQYLDTPYSVNRAVVQNNKDGVIRAPVYTDYAANNAGFLLASGLGYNGYLGNRGDVSGTTMDALDLEITGASIQQAHTLSTKHDIRLGKYGIDGSDGYILEGAQLAGLAPTAPFNQDNQDKIFAALFKKYGTSLRQNYQDLPDHQKLYLDKTFEMMNKETISSYRDPSIMNQKALALLYDRGYYNATV